MTPEPTKEAMEKARELLNGWRNVVWVETGYRTALDAVAIEFTNYQKRIDELEKALIDVLNKDLGGKSVKSQSMVAAELCLAKGGKTE
jgi:hypothetical protein